MLLVAPVREERRLDLTDEQEALFGIDKLNVPRSDIPAITHVNYSARVQSVNRLDNADYHDLIAAFEARTGCGLVVNTSFNVRGEPIVCTPADAYTCFMRTNIDYLALGPFLLAKDDQPEWTETQDWRDEIALD
jgi:carbamoyltransferase